MSTTDPESGYMVRDGKPEGFFYLDHRTVDGKYNFITDVYVTPGNVHDSVPYLERLDRQISRFRFQVEEVALDAGYLTMPICQGLKEREIFAVIAHRSFRPKKGLFFEELKKYPCMKGIVIHNQRQEIYFRSEEEKQNFIHKVKGIPTATPRFLKHLGTALGFPPKAIDFYIQCRENKALEWKKIGLHYCGIDCIGNIEDIVENVLWFWSLDIPKDEYRVIELNYNAIEPRFSFKIPFGDKDQLYIAAEEIAYLTEKRKSREAQ